MGSQVLRPCDEGGWTSPSQLLSLSEPCAAWCRDAHPAETIIMVLWFN